MPVLAVKSETTEVQAVTEFPSLFESSTVATVNKGGRGSKIEYKKDGVIKKKQKTAALFQLQQALSLQILVGLLVDHVAAGVLVLLLKHACCNMSDPEASFLLLLA